MTNDLVYLAVGHGLTTQGTWDVGAVAPDTTREYDLARRICGTAGDEIQNRYHHHLYTEYGLGYSRDPDYVGSAKKANELKAALAVEVHLDWAGAPRGGSGLFVSAEGSRLSSLTSFFYGLASLPTRPNVYRPDLWFLNGTDMPAMLWEADRVGADVNATECVAIGKAIAAGIHVWLTKR